MAYTFRSLEMTSTGQQVTFFFFYQCSWNIDSGYSFYQFDQVVSTWSLHCNRLRTCLSVEDSKGPTNVIWSKMLIFSYLPVIPIRCFSDGAFSKYPFI